PSEPVTYAVMNSASIPFAFQTGKGVEGEERFDGGFKFLNPTMMQSMPPEPQSSPPASRPSSPLDAAKDTGLPQAVLAASLRRSLLEQGSQPPSAPQSSPLASRPSSPSDAEKDTGFPQAVPAASLRGSLVEQDSQPPSEPQSSPPASRPA
ncbi:MAG: hypothetical protein CMF51_04470, partial [Legionellales bacterium]|nr:hypothetical protein [Legionellales bacterium]